MSRRSIGQRIGGTALWIGALCATSIIGFGSEPITADNVRSLVEASHLDVGMHVFKLAFLSDTRLAVADSARAAFWNLELEEPTVVLTQSEIGRVIGLSPDRQLLAIYAPSRDLEIWTVDPLEKQCTLCPIVDTEWPAAVFSPDGRLLAGHRGRAARHRTHRDGLARAQAG